MKNFKKIKDKILQTKSGFQVSNTEQLTKKISDLLSSKIYLKKQLIILKNYVFMKQKSQNIN